MTVRLPRGLLVGFIAWGTAAAVFGVAGCSSSMVHTSAIDSSGARQQTTDSTGPNQAGPAGSGTGNSDLNTICPKLPVVDAQTLITTKLPSAVADGRLGGCTFVLQGKQLADNNLTVIIEQGSEAAQRYTEDVNGTIIIGDTTASAGPPSLRRSAEWGTKPSGEPRPGIPEMSALKGDVYCSVSTADNATQLTIIGSANSPLPNGTQAQQLQYAELEGKLCDDVFGLVH